MSLHAPILVNSFERVPKPTLIEELSWPDHRILMSGQRQ